MPSARCLILTSILALAPLAPGQNLINRVVCTSVEPATGPGQVVFADAETGSVTAFYLPAGYIPGGLVAMDRNGDVWLGHLSTYTLQKFSATTGQVLATAPLSRRATYVVTDRQANLIVGSYDTTPGPQASVYLEKYSPTGQLLHSLDVRNLFPPGAFVPTSMTPLFGAGIPRILVGRSGSLWFTVFGAGFDPVNDPGSPSVPWYSLTHYMILPLVQGYSAYTPGFHLDGAQRLWVLRNTYPHMVNLTPAATLWNRMPREPLYTAGYLEVWVGDTFRTNTTFLTSWIWTSYWGPASLYEYVFYTDPDGDLDQDGVSNRQELLSFTNPLLPFAPSVQTTITGAALGSWLLVDYTVPTDAGLPYAAPFAFTTLPTPVAPGITIP